MFEAVHHGRFRAEEPQDDSGKSRKVHLRRIFHRHQPAGP
ncbi:hypothetical protein chiPu_0023843, partial [Chiloscyllium punctatum]|nr:hypothetical protein [Chiloscyllium punctatum]